MTERAMVSISKVSDEGGAIRTWVVPAEEADELGAYLTRKLGPPDAESIATTEGRRRLVDACDNTSGVLTTFGEHLT